MSEPAADYSNRSHWEHVAMEALPTMYALQTRHGVIDLDDAMRTAIYDALMPILETRIEHEKLENDGQQRLFSDKESKQ